MTSREKIHRGYTISFLSPADSGGAYSIHYIPRGVQSPEFKALVQPQVDDAPVRWQSPPLDSEVSQEDFELDARQRATTLHLWLTRLGELITTVETWASELGWATRRIDKPMEDSEIGKYRVPALLLQEGTNRILLEPVGRSSPGTEGVVDLYRMPAYDDIASLYYYDQQWHLHYMVSGTNGSTNGRSAPAQPLSRVTLQSVLDEMKKHVA